MRKRREPDEHRHDAGHHPGEGEEEDERDTAAEMGGHVGAHPHQRELAQRNLPGPTGEDRQRQGDHAVDADLGHEERSTDVEHEGQQRGDRHRDEDTGRPHPSSQCVAAVSEAEGPGHPRRPLGGARALLQGRGPDHQGQQQQHEEDELDGGRPRRRVGDVPLQEVLDDADPDARHEGDGQAHHAADQRGQQGQE